MTCDRGERNVRWGLLYATALLLIGLCGVIEVFVPIGALRAILQVVAVMTGFGLMALWVRCNRVALELEQTRQHRLVAKPAQRNGNVVGVPVRPQMPRTNGPVPLPREAHRQR